MKKLIFFLLFTVSIYGQTLQNPTFGIVTEKTNATDSAPAYFTTSQVDGVHKKTPAANVEKTANKQNSLATDGTGTKYPTVDVINKVTNHITPEQFGAIGDGVTDDTTPIQNALNSLVTTGGELRFKAKKYLINGQITIPNDGNTVNPKMGSIIIKGEGAGHTGRGTAPVGGTQLDMRYSGTYGKIVGVGLGLLKIQDIAFIDGGSDATPFIYGTNPTMHISDCSFYGTKFGVLADQDAIVLGGTQNVEGFNGIDDGFQGYGTVIENNYFGKIRRAVYGRVFFNGNVIQNNTIWNTCGSNIAGIGAIEIDGDPANTTGQKAVGNVITGNLIEATGYDWSIVLKDSEQNSIIGNNFFDPTPGVTIGFINLDSESGYNNIQAGFHSDSYDFVNSSAIAQNSVIIQHQGQETTISENWKFSNYIIAKPILPRTVSDGFRLEGLAGSQLFHRIYGENEYYTVMSDNLANETQVQSFKNFGGGILRQTYKGTDSRIESEGTLRIRSGGAGSELLLGDTSATNLYIIDGVLYSNKVNGTNPFSVTSKTPVDNLTVKRINTGTLVALSDTAIDGAKIFSGNTTPESNLTALVGSIYLRTDGGAGSTLYVKESGTGASGWSVIPPSASPTFTGTPTAPTPTAGDNSTKIATTAFVQNAMTSGTYVPTFTNTTNISSSTLNAAYYTKINNIITVTIAVQLTLTATADTVFTFSLPVSGATVVNGVGQGNLTSGGGSVNAYGIVDTTNSTTAQLRIGSAAVAGSGAGVANIIFTYSL